MEATDIQIFQDALIKLDVYIYKIYIGLVAKLLLNLFITWFFPTK